MAWWWGRAVPASRDGGGFSCERAWWKYGEWRGFSLISRVNGAEWRKAGRPRCGRGVEGEAGGMYALRRGGRIGTGGVPVLPVLFHIPSTLQPWVTCDERRGCCAAYRPRHSLVAGKPHPPRMRRGRKGLDPKTRFSFAFGPQSFRTAGRGLPAYTFPFLSCRRQGAGTCSPAAFPPHSDGRGRPSPSAKRGRFQNRKTHANEICACQARGGRGRKWVLRGDVAPRGTANTLQEKPRGPEKGVEPRQILLSAYVAH